MLSLVLIKCMLDYLWRLEEIQIARKSEEQPVVCVYGSGMEWI